VVVEAEALRLVRFQPISFWGCVEPPAAGDTFELVLAAIVEGEAGARDEILDGLRHEYLGGPGVSCTGRDERSSRPSSPSARQRAHHFAAVRSLTPAAAAARRNVQPHSTRSTSSRRLRGQVLALP
jgi:hypothetical protein